MLLLAAVISLVCDIGIFLCLSGAKWRHDRKQRSCPRPGILVNGVHDV